MSTNDPTSVIASWLQMLCQIVEAPRNDRFGAAQADERGSSCADLRDARL